MHWAIACNSVGYLLLGLLPGTGRVAGPFGLRGAWLAEHCTAPTCVDRWFFVFSSGHLLRCFLVYHIAWFLRVLK